MKCLVCNLKTNKWVDGAAINDELATSWKLSLRERRKFDLRETQFCPNCRNSARTRALAEAILKVFPIKSEVCLEEWIKLAKNIQVAEINTCGNLHHTLRKLSNLKYSEYYPKIFDKNLKITIKRLIQRLKNRGENQDITKLTYKDNSFDLVLHSDTLEHIKDVERALKECKRVLKPGGYCLFTTPVIPNRKTIKQNTPSFHGSGTEDNLVQWEFGWDFIKRYKLEIVVSKPDEMVWVFGFRK